MSTAVGGWQRGKVTAVLLAVLAVAVMAAALRVSQDRSDFQTVEGSSGRTLAIRGGTIEAGNVRIGDRLTREGAVTSETAGAFVVVELQLAATGNRDLGLASPLLLTRDGYTYRTYDASLLRVASGFRASKDFVFEVDPAHLDDLTLQVGESELVSGYQQRARTHLGITPGNADQWRAAARDRGVEPRSDEQTEALG